MAGGKGPETRPQNDYSQASAASASSPEYRAVRQSLARLSSSGLQEEAQVEALGALNQARPSLPFES